MKRLYDGMRFIGLISITLLMVNCGKTSFDPNSRSQRSAGAAATANCIYGAQLTQNDPNIGREDIYNPFYPNNPNNPYNPNDPNNPYNPNDPNNPYNPNNPNNPYNPNYPNNPGTQPPCNYQPGQPIPPPPVIPQQPCNNYTKCGSTTPPCYSKCNPCQKCSRCTTSCTSPCRRTSRCG